MAGRVWFNVYVTVKDGRLEEFKRLAKAWTKFNKERPEILGYEWFSTGDDETKVQVMEVYEDADALLAYMERAAQSDETPDYPYDTTKVEVLGDVSDALRKRLDAGTSPIEYFARFEGFSRR